MGLSVELNEPVNAAKHIKHNLWVNQARFAGVFSVAAPRPISRLCQSGNLRVLANVADDREQIAVVFDRLALEPILEKMAAPAMSAIELRGMCPGHSPHTVRDIFHRAPATK